MGAAAGSRTLVIDAPAGEAGEDQRKGGTARTLRHPPDGRGCGAERLVSENPKPDRCSATKTRSGVGRGDRRQGKNDTT